MKRGLTCVLVGLMLLGTGLAGCIGTTDEPAETTDASADGEDAAPSSAETGAEASGQRTADNATPELVRETRELEWDGYMPEQLGVCATATGCPVWLDGPTPVSEERDNVYEIGTNPMPVAAEFTLTWDDPQATGHEMLFGIVTDGCERGCQEIIWKEGTSGVTISVDDINLTESDGFAVTVHHTYNYYPGGAYYTTGPPVDFTVTGTYDVLVAPS